jgi:hypothetical protein
LRTLAGLALSALMKAVNPCDESTPFRNSGDLARRTIELEVAIRGGRIRMRQVKAAAPVKLITLLKGSYATN